MSIVNLINDMQELIERHGIERVKETVLFLDRMSTIPSNKITLRAYTGFTVNVTAAQLNELNELMNTTPPAFITAIKRLHKMTGIGLKDSKDTIETIFKGKKGS